MRYEATRRIIGPGTVFTEGQIVTGNFYLGTDGTAVQRFVKSCIASGDLKKAGPEPKKAKPKDEK